MHPDLLRDRDRVSFYPELQQVRIQTTAAFDAAAPGDQE
jgi:hypothetical protein